MAGRFSGADASLNATQSADDGARAWIDVFEVQGTQAAETVRNNHDTATLRARLVTALPGLTARTQAARQVRDAGKSRRCAWPVQRACASD